MGLAEGLKAGADVMDKAIRGARLGYNWGQEYVGQKALADTITQYAAQDKAIQDNPDLNDIEKLNQRALLYSDRNNRINNISAIMNTEDARTQLSNQASALALDVPYKTKINSDISLGEAGTLQKLYMSALAGKWDQTVNALTNNDVKSADPQIMQIMQRYNATFDPATKKVTLADGNTLDRAGVLQVLNQFDPSDLLTREQARQLLIQPGFTGRGGSSGGAGGSGGNTTVGVRTIDLPVGENGGMAQVVYSQDGNQMDAFMNIGGQHVRIPSHLIARQLGEDGKTIIPSVNQEGVNAWVNEITKFMEKAGEVDPKIGRFVFDANSGSFKFKPAEGFNYTKADGSPYSPDDFTNLTAGGASNLLKTLTANSRAIEDDRAVNSVLRDAYRQQAGDNLFGGIGGNYWNATVDAKKASIKDKIAARLNKTRESLKAEKTIGASKRDGTPEANAKYVVSVNTKAFGSKAPLSDRTNNPGNIKYSNDSGFEKSVGPTRANGTAYHTFKTIEDGVDAAVKVCDTYFRRHGIDTVRSFVQRWVSDADGNNVDNAVKNYCKITGFKPDEKIAYTKENVKKLMKACFINEGCTRVSDAMLAAVVNNVWRERGLEGRAYALLGDRYGKRKQNDS